VYQHFGNRLREEGLAYEGLLYRSLAENMPEVDQILPGRIILAGLNALKKAEEKIVITLVKEYDARLLWDVDRHYLEQTVQEAGMFYRQYRKHPVLGKGFPEILPDHLHQGQVREIRLQGVTLEVGQAKNTGVLLQELAAQQGFVPEKTVIILPDEHLLFPVLHSLPPVISRVNVTMGYPLRNTSLYSFVEHLLNLQLEKQTDSEKTVFHHTTLLALLRHPYVRYYEGAAAVENIAHIERTNAVYVSAGELKGEAIFYQTLLQPVTEVSALFDYLKEVSGMLHHMVGDEEEANTEEMSIPMLERELLYHFYLQINRLRALTRERQLDFRLSAFIRLLRQIFQGLRVPFTGEPLRGLQIMGLLESRNLDFDHVFLLSANEGILPPADAQRSFIPQNLKKGFGLFTTEQQDAFYAHAFYRLLHQAKKVYLFHNTEDLQHLSGEMSRFLYQIKYESRQDASGHLRFPDARADFRVQQHFLSRRVTAAPVPAISIEKSEAVWNKLRAFTLDAPPGTKQQQLTPSALNTYMDCRLKFYYQFVVRLQETEAVEEEVDAMVFGNILHKTMELLYRRFMANAGRTTITAADCQRLQGKALDKAIAEGFAEHFHRKADDPQLFMGRNAIAREIVRKMAFQILEHDRQYAPFQIISLEARGAAGYATESSVKSNGETLRIALKGIIDRVDRKDEVIRVLDYKTGRDERKAADVASLFDRDHALRNKAAMQAMFYGWLYQQTQPHETGKIVPGLINATVLFRDDFDSRLQIGKQVLNDFTAYQADFTAELQKLLQEIFNPAVPFDQTGDAEKCKICPYANICY